MDVANEILDAIEIIVDKKIRENTAQIYFGVCKSVNGDSCVMSINGKNNTIHFYGSAPIVGLTYRVFVPNGNMSMAFAITGNDDRKGLYYSNPNLLDNWYFGNPVNQRGQTSYTDSGYGIDRWILGGASTVTAVLTANGITLTRTGTSWTTMFQKIENSNDLLGKVVTFSFLTADNRLVSGTLTLPTSLNGSAAIFAEDNVTRWYLDYYAGASGFDFRIIQNNETVIDAVTIKATKLELGTTQTLAHQENGVWVLNEIPDYGEQLARCQRYFQLYSSADLRPAKAVDCRPTMLADPSQGTIIIDGTTYYYNTADL